MLVSDFDYNLPEELIAQVPLEKRDLSRMMILDRHNDKISHSHFRHFPEYLEKGDLLVLNNSKVIPARVWGQRKDAEIEFLFLEEIQKGTWEVLCRPAKKAKSGDLIHFSPTLQGEVIKEGPQGHRLIRLNANDIISELKTIGYAPLPPYIKRKKLQMDIRPIDLERYQTVFAHEDGSIAAPTAGLHFTPSLLDSIKAKGVEVVEITLDVGLATFQPVRVTHVNDHHMLEERYTISKDAAKTINNAKKENRPVIAVGTTSVRALESAFTKDAVQRGKQKTDLFIHPGYTFRVIDKLLTNFHLPKSTLLMLVSAFAGMDFIKKAYTEAVHKKYRFYSYGDCMLIQ
ncbi:MAG: tRNA preQ1(34) S-adenosylmethionine ribosyltransferase-isomerase QueA [Candidatus Aminicenantes bacterium]|jgi:S-adenosylmethionine:tRNA ribosyltransferase-isomerase